MTTTTPIKAHTRERTPSSSSSSSRLSLYILISFATLLTFLQSQPLHYSLPSIHWRRSVPFLPLKDLRFSETPMDGNTWFMSSLNDTREGNESEHLLFPSSGNQTLCLAGRSPSNGTMNSYALTSAGELPHGARLLGGLTFISDTYYDYMNLYHGMSAMTPFVAWHERKGCVLPRRWELYHHGEVRTKISPWLRSLMRAVFNEEMWMESVEQEGIRCFERAVVFRHQEGKMSRRRKEEVYEVLRCKAREYCGIERQERVRTAIRLTLLLRVGARSFKEDNAVAEIFEKECRKVEGCRLKVARPSNLTFCDQVKLLSSTDILASPHGAQMTNMIFMDKGGSIMEFFPKGWDLAGVGQYVFRWIANWAGLVHQGVWIDPNSDIRPCNKKPESQCFALYKNGRIGHDTAFFVNWTATVLQKTRENKNKLGGGTSSWSPCPCS